MNKQEKNKQKKKNERNKRVKLKLANRREYARKERKIVLEEERAKRETELLVNGKQKPIVNDINKSKEVAKLKEELIKEQLEKGFQLEFNGSNVVPNSTVNYVKFNNEIVGVGIFVEDEVLPSYAIVKQANGKSLIFDDYNPIYIIKDRELENLKNYFKLHFS